MTITGAMDAFSFQAKCIPMAMSVLQRPMTASVASDQPRNQYAQSLLLLLLLATGSAGSMSYVAELVNVAAKVNGSRSLGKELRMLL